MHKTHSAVLPFPPHLKRVFFATYMSMSVSQRKTRSICI
jgi:hypothetical protein